MIRKAALIVALTGIAVTAEAGDYEQADVYRGLREQALSLDAQAVPPRDGTIALLMETGYETAVVTVLAAADGSASIYFSNGGGIIGAGEYEQVQEVVFESLAAAKHHSGDLSNTDNFPLPQPGQTRFFMVTADGVLTAAADEQLLVNEKHELSPLFHQVHKLIAWIRKADEHRQSQQSE